MEIKINIEKKHIYILIGIVVLFTSVLLTFAINPSTDAWHSLQYIATDNTGTTSVDADNNSIIDNAEDVTCSGCVTPAEVNFDFATSDTVSGDALNSKSCSADSVCEANDMYVSGRVGIGTTNPGTNKLEVVGGPIKATGGLIIQTVSYQAEEDSMAKSTGQIWLRTDI